MMCILLLKYFVLLWCFCLSTCTNEAIDAKFNTLYTNTTINNETVQMYRYTVKTNDVVRVWVQSSNATRSNPLLTVATERRAVLSWQVPFQQDQRSYDNVARTLCPYSRNSVSNETEMGSITVSLSSQSPDPVEYHLNVTLVQNFTLKMNEDYDFTSKPSQPQVWHFKFPKDIDSVMVVATAWDEICMLMSVQPVNCPIYDLDNNVVYSGEYQTVTTKGAIPVTRDSMGDEFYVVLVVKSDNYACNRSSTFRDISPSHPESGNSRRKYIKIRIEENIGRLQFNLAVIVTFGVCAGFYLLAAIVGCGLAVGDRKERIKNELRLFGVSDTERDLASSINELRGSSTSGEREPLVNEEGVEAGPSTSATPSSPVSLQAPPNYGSLDANCSGDLAASEKNKRKLDEKAKKKRAGSSEDDNEYDTLDDMNDVKAVVRSKTKLTVDDLARKPWKQRDKKYRLYRWNLLTISVFYTLPVIQLVFTYQSFVNDNGNQDLCYYNFLCARHWGPLFDFNHFFSNTGYILLGVLFLILVKRRQWFHQSQYHRQPTLETEYGVPRHYGLFNAMGLALIMEGIMSACYHVCPNNTNYQFDTAFMYMIGALGMLKLYQIRHPDINANSHVAYNTMACVILLSVVGVLWNSLAFWILFSTFYIVLLLLISCEFYYKGEWHVGKAMINGLRQQLASVTIYNFWKPAFPDRLLLIFIWDLLNMSFVGVGLAKQPADFPSFLVTVFVANLLLYTLYYSCMKLKHGERFRLRLVAFVVLGSASWAASLYFFFNATTSWRQSPSKSRELNRPCILLNFYDNHDVWHFLSALSLFLSFLIILNLDDDLDYTNRKEIAVF